MYVILHLKEFEIFARHFVVPPYYKGAIEGLLIIMIKLHVGTKRISLVCDGEQRRKLHWVSLFSSTENMKCLLLFSF